MGRGDYNFWPPPIEGLDYDLEGPSADYLMDVSDIYEQTVYEDIHVSTNEWTIVDKDEAVLYLPKRQESLSVTLGIEEKKTVDLPTFGSIKLDENFQFKRGFVVNSGINVWGLDFVPKSIQCADPLTQYLAISGYRGAVEEHVGLEEIQPAGSYRNSIQIWKMKLSTQLPSETPILDLCLLHDFGVIHDLKWCPYGIYKEEGTEENPARLGILAFVCGDGAVRTIVVPHPNYVRTSMCANVSETVYLRINSSRCVFNLGISKPLTFSWGGHKKLAVGYTSGNVVVWNVEKALHDEQSRTGESTRRCVIFSSNVLDAGIRSLCWNGVRDPERMIIGGLDGRLVHLDTNDPHINLLINRARGVQLNCGWQGHDTIMLYVDADGLTRGCAFNADGGLSFNKLGDCTGMCWSIGTSEHHGHFALSTAIGWVRTSNMYQVKLKKLLITQNTVYKLHYNHDTGIYRYIDGIGPQTLDEAKKLPVYSQYGDSQMSIQKVAWNPNKPTCAFLASGGAAGLCRIDFEGRGSNWE